MLVDEIKDDPRKDAQDYAERVARGFRPEIPWRWPSQLVELIQACWHQVCEQGQECGESVGQLVWEGKCRCGCRCFLLPPLSALLLPHLRPAPALIVWTPLTPQPLLHASQLHRLD